MNIFVAKLSFDIESEDLKKAFEQYGEVTSASVITDKFTGKSKGYAFVEMPNDEEAQSAIQGILELDGRTIVVKKAEARGGGYIGGGGYVGGGGAGRAGGGGRYYERNEIEDSNSNSTSGTSSMFYPKSNEDDEKSNNIGLLLKLNENIKDFDNTRALKLIHELKILLNTDDNIIIESIESGSVIVKLKLSNNNARKLLALLSTGQLNGFDVSKVELLKYEKEKNTLNGFNNNEKNTTPIIYWKKEIKESIAKNDFSKVFNELKQKLPPEEPFYNEAINLEARYNENQKTERNGITDKKNTDIELNNIRSSILKMVNEID